MNNLTRCEMAMIQKKVMLTGNARQIYLYYNISIVITMIEKPSLSLEATTYAAILDLGPKSN